PAAEDAGGPLVQDPRREQAELELLVADVHGVPGVRATLVAGNDGVALGQHVDDLALALVAPLGADDHGCRHGPEGRGWAVPDKPSRDGEGPRPDRPMSWSHGNTMAEER